MNLIQVRLVLGIAAAVLHGTAFYLYARQMNVGKSHPNIATWSISSFLMLLNALTFGMMSNDWVATFQLFVGFGGCLIVLVYALVKGKFSLPGPTEGWAMLLGITASVLWYEFRQAAGANMIILFALCIALAPTWRGVYHDPFRETPRSWVIWAIAYVVTTINVLLNPNWHLISLVTPFVSIFAHGGVAVLANEGRKTHFYKIATR